jgi:hypothetical protein
VPLKDMIEETLLKIDIAKYKESLALIFFTVKQMLKTKFDQSRRLTFLSTLIENFLEKGTEF